MESVPSFRAVVREVRDLADALDDSADYGLATNPGRVVEALARVRDLASYGLAVPPNFVSLHAADPGGDLGLGRLGSGESGAGYARRVYGGDLPVRARLSAGVAAGVAAGLSYADPGDVEPPAHVHDRAGGRGRCSCGAPAPAHAVRLSDPRRDGVHGGRGAPTG